MNKDEAWQDFCEKTMPQKDKSYVYALDGTMYAVWCAAWDAAKHNWISLTDDEVMNIADMDYADDQEFARNVETNLKEKNGG